jgi:hypothetical protein
VSESNQIKNAINFSVWRKFIQFQKANENFGGVGDFDYGRQAGSLCKNPGCQNLCGPLHFYPIDLQQKIKNQEFNLPKRCVDCITASRLPMPQQVANAVRHAPTAHSDATWTARSSNAHPGGPSEGILCKLDSLEAQFEKLSSALLPMRSLLAVHLQLARLHTLNESHAVGMLGFGKAPLRIYSSPSYRGITDKFTAASAHFYFHVAAAAPDDVQDSSKFCMIGHDVWVLITHDFEMLPRGVSPDWCVGNISIYDLPRFVNEARHNDAVRRYGGWSDTAPLEAEIPLPTSASAASIASQELGREVERPDNTTLSGRLKIILGIATSLADSLDDRGGTQCGDVLRDCLKDSGFIGLLKTEISFQTSASAAPAVRQDRDRAVEQCDNATLSGRLKEILES